MENSSISVLDYITAYSFHPEQSGFTWHDSVFRVEWTHTTMHRSGLRPWLEHPSTSKSQPNLLGKKLRAALWCSLKLRWEVTCWSWSHSGCTSDALAHW